MSEKSRVFGVEFVDQEEVIVSQQPTVTSVSVVYNTMKALIILMKLILRKTLNTVMIADIIPN